MEIDDRSGFPTGLVWGNNYALKTKNKMTESTKDGPSTQYNLESIALVGACATTARRSEMQSFSSTGLAAGFAVEEIVSERAGSLSIAALEHTPLHVADTV